MVRCISKGIPGTGFPPLMQPIHERCGAGHGAANARIGRARPGAGLACVLARAHWTRLAPGPSRGKARRANKEEVRPPLGAAA